MNASDVETLQACPVCSATRTRLESERLELRSCERCGVFYNSPRPSKSFIERNYSEGEYYARFAPDEKWNAMWTRRLDRVMRHAPTGPVFDVSAGVGTAVNQLRARGVEAAGSEISKEAIEAAKRLYGLDLTESYPDDLQLADESLGGLMMWHVFEHLPFPGRSLQHLAAKIRPGGLLVIAVPNNSFARLARHARLWLAPREARLEALFGKVDYSRKFQEIHLIHFTPASLRRVVEAAGFEMVEYGVDNVLSEWRDAKLPLRNFAANYLGFNDAAAMLMISRKVRAPDFSVFA